MTYRIFCALAAAMLAGGVALSNAAEQPNIVFILADDLGYGDLGCYGHPVAKTPRLDQLARQGTRFTQHYANGPECSPTRTALLTGRYQQRVGGLECAIGTGNVGRYDDAIELANRRELGLPPEFSELPNRLVQQGYRCGIFGKWHLGYEPQFNPMHHGWHEFFGYLGGNVHYFNHRETSDLHVLFEGVLPVYRDGYMTKLITDESIEFIRRQEGPFFVFVSHETPHFPFQGPDDSAKLVTAENWMEIDQATYVKMLENLDTEVGRILDQLDRQGIAKETLVVFASDNGGFAAAASMGTLRGAKGTTFEGGIRVPLMMRWPEQVPAGQVSEQVCATFDLTKSFLKLGGVDTDSVALDGIDIVQHLVDGNDDFARTLFWRGKRGDRTWTAVRDGDMKFVRKQEGDSVETWLFDLAEDPGETTDLQTKNPTAARRLVDAIEQWEQEVRPVR